MLILMLEDTPSLNKLYTKILEQLGHEVMSEPNGDHAVKILRSVPVDLMITDMMMDGKEGFETIDEVRKAGFDVPIIAMSAIGEYAEHATHLGADAMLEKPFTVEQLQTVLQEFDVLA